MIQLPIAGEMLAAGMIARIKVVSETEVRVWLLNTDPTNQNAFIAYRDDDAVAILEAARYEAPAEQFDDLTQINGIGERIAAGLADHGITTFAELAETEDDVLAIALAADAVGLDRSDVQGWIDQAAQLAA